MTPIWEDPDQSAVPEPPAADTPAAEASTPAGDLVSAVASLPLPNSVGFSTRHIGGGYDRSEVDAFVKGLTQTIAEVRSALDQDRRELAGLRAENARLAAENARLNTPANAELEQEVTLGAVGLLSQAQVIADKAVADAEAYARDLVIAARTQYREAVERAAEQPDAPDLPGVPGLAGTQAAASHAPAMPEIEYVRTYAKVAQIQLRSVLEALTEQVDRLGSLPQPDGEPAGAAGAAVPSSAVDDDLPDEEPHWLPEVPPEPAVQRQTYIRPA
ncbi:hypothetical protein GE115_06665 [Agromyces sp. CFH 90414]|uniref:Antigen 84 n=1 Tax=Agromyces agglutinans TaxID=2662258 RepID=A0A6I2F243_9MICO|nr:hypothetical protein [Agromyces agglutinans]MRG59555.1 hypothetical protein [Agromyces agglutinans]